MAKKRYTGPYVSRGGEKLRGALEDFSFDVRELSALDVGASTGGFSDCLLQAGASFVTALDVAYGQFAWSLRQDPRVHVVERTNFKTADLSTLPEPFAPPYDLIVADLSFISLAKLTEQFKAVLSSQGSLLLLVKPQFEALREEIPQGGVIGDPKLHMRILERLVQTYAEAGFLRQEWTYSPIKGPKGNIEFWLRAQMLPFAAEPDSIHSENEVNCATIKASVEEVVKQAHAHL